MDISKSKNGMNRKLVPWWTEECCQAVNRNRAFRQVRRTHNMQHLIHYKKAQAVVRRMIRQAKRASWRNFCNKIGRTTLWEKYGAEGNGNIHSWHLRRKQQSPIGIRQRSWPSHSTNIHSSENLSEEGRKRRTMSQHPGVLDRRE